MTDRLPGSPGKYSAVVAGEELQKLQTGKPFAIHLQLDDDPVREGTPYSKAAVLPDALAEKICPDIEDPAPKDALAGLWEKKADGICRKTGTTIALNDSAHTPLKGLKLFGQTTQNGTPTPDAPVELESVGASGNILVTVAGKNLFPKASAGVLSESGITFTSNGDGSYSVKGTASGEVTLYFPLEESMVLIKGAYLHLMNNVSANVSFVYWYDDNTSSYWALSPANRISAPSKNFGKTVTRVGINIQSGNTVDVAFSPMFVFSDKVMDFVPYQPIQTLTASTPNGLPGIPVSSDGNYTDENGQQWICDEIDFARGVYVQRVYQFSDLTTATGGNYQELGNYARLQIHIGSKTAYPAAYRAMCNISPWGAVYSADYLHHYADTTALWVFVPIAELESQDVQGALAWLNAKNAEFQYILATPIETALSAEELEAYATLHTNKLSTTVLNDAGAGMETSYYTPATAVQMVHSPVDVGKILAIDEHGCVVLANQKDRVVEQGVSGDWVYRKWENGFAECWISVANNGTDGSTLTNVKLPFPFIGFPNALTYNATVVGSAGTFYQFMDYGSEPYIDDSTSMPDTTKTGALKFIIFSYKPSTNTVNENETNTKTHLYITGRWK